MSETLKSTMRKAAVVAMVALGLLTGQAEAATLYISEFASGVSQGGTATAQVAPQIAVADQTVALSGSSALSSAFNSKTNAVTLMCDEGCSIKFGTTNAVSATTSNYLLQQGVYYRYGAAPGWFVAAIANAAGNTATGAGGATNATIVGPLGQTTMSASVPVAIASDQSSVPVTATGNVANAVADSGNPIKTGSVAAANTGALTPVTAGNRVNDLDDLYGNRRSFNVLFGSGGSDGFVNSGIGWFGADSSASPSARLLGGVAPSIFNGSTWDRQFTCPLTAPVSVSAAATTQIVALVASQIIRVCSFDLTISVAGTATFVYGTGTNCASSPVSITGAMAIGTTQSLPMSSANGSLFRTIASNALCLTAATGNVTGFVTYAQY